MKKSTAGKVKPTSKTTEQPAARAATAKAKPQTKRATATARSGERSGRAGTAKSTAAKSAKPQTKRATPARAKTAKPQTKPARAAESAIQSDRTARQILDAAAERTPFGDGAMPQTLALNFMENYAREAGRHLRKRGSGRCTIAGFNVTLKRATRPATKARPGYNPSTKEKMTVPAKPARTVVRARVGKRYLDSIGLTVS